MPDGFNWDSLGTPVDGGASADGGDKRRQAFERNKAWTLDGAKDFTTKLAPEEEARFQGWVKSNNVPFQDGQEADYDMRGFWKASQDKKGWEALQKKGLLPTNLAPAGTKIDPNDGKPHYPDYWKTPYHETFSSESQWANRDKAPNWNDKDQLVGVDGTVLFDDKAPKAAPQQAAPPQAPAVNWDSLGTPVDPQAPPNPNEKLPFNTPPGAYRGAVLPFMTDAQGHTSLAVPGFIASPLRGVMEGGQEALGERPVDDPSARMDIFNAASLGARPTPGSIPAELNMGFGPRPGQPGGPRVEPTGPAPTGAPKGAAAEANEMWEAFKRQHGYDPRTEGPPAAPAQAAPQPAPSPGPAPAAPAATPAPVPTKLTRGDVVQVVNPEGKATGTVFGIRSDGKVWIDAGDGRNRLYERDPVTDELRRVEQEAAPQPQEPPEAAAETPGTPVPKSEAKPGHEITFTENGKQVTGTLKGRRQDGRLVVDTGAGPYTFVKPNDVLAARAPEKLPDAAPEELPSKDAPEPPKTATAEKPAAETPTPEQPVTKTEAPKAEEPKAEPEEVTHTTKRGRVLRGTIVKGITADEARKRDPSASQKDGGWFIRATPKPAEDEKKDEKPQAEAPAEPDRTGWADGPWTEAGQNEEGQTVYANPKGRHAVADEGAPWMEAEGTAPDARAPRFKVVEAEKPAEEKSAGKSGIKAVQKPAEAPDKSTGDNSAPVKPPGQNDAANLPPTGAPASEPKPEPKKPAPKAKSDWAEIGKNHIGQTLYEDQHGVRSYIENGVRSTESVQVGPRGSSVKAPADKGADYQVAAWHPTQAHRGEPEYKAPVTSTPAETKKPAKPKPEASPKSQPAAPNDKVTHADVPTLAPVDEKSFTSDDIGTMVRPKPGSGLDVVKNAGKISHVQSSSRGPMISVNGGPHFYGSDFERVPPTEHPGLVIQSLKTGKVTHVQPPGTVPPKAAEEGAAEIAPPEEPQAAPPPAPESDADPALTGVGLADHIATFRRMLEERGAARLFRFGGDIDYRIIPTSDGNYSVERTQNGNRTLSGQGASRQEAIDNTVAYAFPNVGAANAPAPAPQSAPAPVLQSANAAKRPVSKDEYEHLQATLKASADMLARGMRDKSATGDELTRLITQHNDAQAALDNAEGPPPKPTGIIGGKTNFEAPWRASVEEHERAVAQRMHDEGTPPAPSPDVYPGFAARGNIHGFDSAGKEWGGTGIGFVRLDADKAFPALLKRAEKRKSEQHRQVPSEQLDRLIATQDQGAERPIAWARTVSEVGGKTMVVGQNADGQLTVLDKVVFDLFSRAAGPGGTLFTSRRVKPDLKTNPSGVFARNAQGELVGLGSPMSVLAGQAKIWAYGQGEAPEAPPAPEPEPPPEPAAPAPEAPANADDRPKYPDGRLIPQVGDQVFQTVPGFGGMPSHIYGEVYGSSTRPRVRTTGSAALIGSAPVGKTYQLTPDWTVKGDPELVRREAARKQAEQDRKAAEEAERAAEDARLDALAQERGTLDPATVKAGDVLEDPEGELHLAGEVWGGGSIFALPLAEPGEPARGIGTDLRGWRKADAEVPEGHIIRDPHEKQRINGQWVPVDWDEATQQYVPIAQTGEPTGPILQPSAEAPIVGPEEVPNGVQTAIPDGDAGAGAEDVHADATGRDTRPASPGNVGKSPRNAGGTARGRASERGGSSAAEPATAGGGDRPGDLDRVPDTGAATDAGATGRPAEAPLQGVNFVIEPGALDETRGRTQKARDNLAAIELTKQLQAEGRLATPAEQAVLAKYVGWGGLKNVFKDSEGNRGKGMEAIGDRLEQVLTPEEYRTAEGSVLNAHYTAENVVRAMWDAVQQMGFTGGSVFEPGMGIGHFLGLMPPDIAARSSYHGIERDHLTADIAKLLYPRAGIEQADYTRLPLPEEAFDLAIGNPPFFEGVVHSDPKYAARRFMLHDYFFAKTLDAVRPGGLLGFITSAGTMNKIDPEAREYLAARAEFLGGVRLPSSAFRQNAGTDVTTDILFFKRRPEGRVPLDQAGDLGWTKTVIRDLPNRDGGISKGHVSQYFSDHPEMVLGEEGMFDKLMASERYAVHQRPGTDLTADLRAALDRLPKDVMTAPPSPGERAALDFKSGQKKDGTFYVAPDGTLMQYSGGAGRPVQARGKGVEGGLTQADRDRIIKLIPVRDALREVFAADLAEDQKAGEAARKDLNAAYDSFVKWFGPINKAEFTYKRPSIVQQESARLEAREDARFSGDAFDDGDFDPSGLLAKNATVTEIAKARQDARVAALEAGRPFNEGSFDPSEMPDVVIDKRPNVRPFMSDPESYRLRSIEAYDDKTGEASKKLIFREPVLKREVEPELKSAQDGLLWSMNALGRFDLDAIAEKMDRPRQDIIADLGDSIFRVPGTEDTYQPRDEYLSGDVVTKLDAARKAAEREPELRRNVIALEAAQPVPLPPSRIQMKLGMPWIPAEVIAEFVRDQLQLGEPRISHNAISGGWVVDTSRIRNAAALPGSPLWGTERRSAHDLLTDALNGTPPRIMTPGTRDTPAEFDPVATQAAQDKYNAIKAAFYDHDAGTGWVKDDPERAAQLADLYNLKMNREVLRKHDGSYLTTPGVSADWSWRPHQTAVVSRIILEGNTYMAHAVGAGKTSAMIGAGMEMRRLGLVKKPMYVVPNHMLGQFTKEFYEQYPTARIAVADEERFHTSRRKQFIANVAQDDLDAVIITHSSFGKIPISDEFQAQLIHDQVDMITEAINDLDATSDRITVGRLQKQREKLEQKLSKRGAGKQDQTLTFEEMGVDFVFVDEAHLFRKLSFATRQGQMKGISPEGSDMSWDLFTKIRYLDGQKPGRAVVFASGTPITNTMGELYSVSRFMQPQAMRARGIEHFDSWAQTFGDTKTSLEETAAGTYQPMTRFQRFVNMPELYKMVGQVMDIVTSKQLEQYVTRPALKGGDRQFHLAPRTEILDEFQAGLALRMKLIKERRGPPQPGDDIILSVINDGRHGAIDPRFIADTQNDPNSKLNMMVANIARIYHETTDHQFYDPATGYEKESFRGPATQMVFANLGINNRGPMGFSSYRWIKEALRRAGVPASEIAVIGDYKTALARQALFNDMNAGKVRILLGSTQKMGTGVNAQRRLYAVHNLDPLWYPADDEQRNGRILRQGNHNREIEIHDYSTKGTYDSAMWKMMGQKAGFIEQFFRGDPDLRDMEDIGEASMYEQASAMSTTDERIITLTQLKQDLEKARRQESAHDSEQYSLRARLKNALWEADHYTQQAELGRKDIADRQDISGKNFSMVVAGETFTKRDEANTALQAAIDERKPLMGANTSTTLGKISGFPILLTQRSKGWFALSLGLNGNREIGISPEGGMVASAEARLRGFEGEVRSVDRLAKEAASRAEVIKPQIGKKFDGGPEIARLQSDVRALEDVLKGEAEAKDKPPVQEVEPEDGLPEGGLAESPVPLYSGVQRAADGLRQGKGTGEQMLAMLAKTPGVKPEEMEWLGLPDWLRGQQSVTKQQIQDYVRANRLDVQEVVKGEVRSDREAHDRLQRMAAFEASFDTLSPEDLAEYERLHAEEQADFDAGTRAATKYSQYALPGGENYREMLLTLPRATPETAYNVVPHPSGTGFAVQRGDGSFITQPAAARNPGAPTRWDSRFDAETYGVKFHRSADRRAAGEYQTGHWDEPNVVAHVRFDERTAPDGARVLMVQEVQSDWHQAGRKGGYKNPDAANEVWRIREQIDQNREELDRRQPGIDFGSEMEVQRAYARHPDLAAREGALFSELARSKEARDRGVPDAPFKTSWPSLVMRRMVKYAVDNGFDRVAWSPGRVHADRYGLGAHISEIEYEPARDDDGQPNGLYEIKAYGTTNQVVLHEDEVPLSRIEELIGGELAGKIKRGEGEPSGGAYREWRTLSGADLKVGGEGMSGFYDNILPKETQKIVGKFGAKVGPGEVGDGLGREFVLHAVHQFDITPALRDAVQTDGLALFEAPGEARNAPMGSGKAPIPRPLSAPQVSRWLNGGGDGFADMLATAPLAGHEAAADWVLAHGRATGLEHLAVVENRTGNIVHAGTNGQPDAVGFAHSNTTGETAAYTLHHNHPSNTAISGIDIQILANPGISHVVAYGHDGTMTRIALGPALIKPEARTADRIGENYKALLDARNAVAKTAAEVLMFALDKGMSKADAFYHYNDVVNRLLHAWGVIDYVSGVRLPDPIRAALRGKLRKMGLSDDLADRHTQPVLASQRYAGLPQAVRGAPVQERPKLAAGGGGGQGDAVWFGRKGLGEDKDDPLGFTKPPERPIGALNNALYDMQWGIPSRWQQWRDSPETIAAYADRDRRGQLWVNVDMERRMLSLWREELAEGPALSARRQEKLARMIARNEAKLAIALAAAKLGGVDPDGPYPSSPMIPDDWKPPGIDSLGERTNALNFLR